MYPRIIVIHGQVRDLCGVKLDNELTAFFYGCAAVGLAVLCSVIVSLVLAPAVIPATVCTYLELIGAHRSDNALIHAVTVRVRHLYIAVPIIEAAYDAQSGKRQILIFTGACGQTDSRQDRRCKSPHSANHCRTQCDRQGLL